MQTSTNLPLIFLLRHGETAWSLTGQHTSHTDLPLTAVGETDAVALGQRLRGVSFAHVFSSPLQRARQTCALAGLADQMQTEPALTEWNYGDYEGLRLADIRHGRPDWHIFRDGCPHGETPGEVTARLDRLIARLRTLDGRMALCSHGHLGRAFAARWLGLPIEDARCFVLGTSSVSVLGYEHDRADEPAIIHWNTASGSVT